MNKFYNIIPILKTSGHAARGAPCIAAVAFSQGGRNGAERIHKQRATKCPEVFRIGIIRVCVKNESGQILLGGLFFLILAISTSVYFIFVSQSIRELYSNTLRARFEKISEATKYANIINEISINNQNIIASLITSQIAYISAIETGLTISYEQPYWQTYANFQKENNKSALSEESRTAIKNSFESYALTSARGLYVAAAFAAKNSNLVSELPSYIRQFFFQSSNAFAQCLALEFQNSDLYISHYVKFLVPNTYQFGLTKKNCTLENKNNFLQKIMSKGLPMLTSNDSDFIIDLNKIDEYFTLGKNYSYGISYVKPEFALAFIQAVNFPVSGTLKSMVRISHPRFMCQNKLTIQGSFTVEENWQNPCEVSTNQFLKSFFKPNWAAFLTYQEKSLKIK